MSGKKRVEKKKNMVTFGLKEKRNPVKFAREKEEVEKMITVTQNKEQKLKREAEKIYKLGIYGEGSKRPLKVKMGS